MADLSRTAVFMDRVEKHLASLPCNAARRAFLQQQQERWEGLYDAFRDRVDSGGDPGNQKAFDYTETILAIEKALARYPAQEAA